MSGPSHGVIVVGRRIDALVLQQSFDDGEVTALSSQSYSVVVIDRRIEYRVPEQIIDNRSVAVLDGAHQGDEFLSFEKNLAGFEHLLHNRQSTTGNVITECVKVDRHLQRKRQTLVLCSDGTVDSTEGDGVDIETRTWGSIHSKSKRCEPARMGLSWRLAKR
jgi:hypothetical protein